MNSGDPQTKRFYDKKGWKSTNNRLLDEELFGVKEDGPIRKELHHIHLQRKFDSLKNAKETRSVLECGCGGSPSVDLYDLFSHYTGVDFSETGIKITKEILEKKNLAHQLKIADICKLPFKDGEFDAVYSAHMIYHISSPDSQAAALKEMVRVTKIGGAVVLITANPRPLLFPIRLLKRVLSDFSVTNVFINKIRSKPVLPYLPMKLSWYRAQLEPNGELDILCNGLPSTYVNQNISEYGLLGKYYWRVLRFLDIHFPKHSALLGNYVIVCFVKNPRADVV